MREERVEVAYGVELAVRRWDGDGSPFLLVHGLASNGRMWDGVADRLAARGHAIVTIDLRGHGRSDKPADGYDFETITDDLRAVVEGLDLDRPVAVGQSWGGNLVLELAHRFPALTSGIACVDGGLIELSERFPDWDECARALAPPALIGTPWEGIERYARSAHPDWPETGIAGVLANFDVRPDGTVAPWLTFEHHMAILRGLWEHRPSSRLDGLAVPLLLLPADTGDPSWTADKQAAIDRAISVAPIVRVRWFAPADHDIHAQHPAELAGVLHDATADGFFS